MNARNLCDPQVWDELKDQLSTEAKRDFLAIYFAQDETPLLACRKAEFLIMLGSDEDDEAALAILSKQESALALGLKAKLFSAQQDKQALEALLKQGFPVCMRQHDFEGALHFRRAEARLAYLKGDFKTALTATQYAQSLALHMQLVYMMKVIASDLKDISRQLGERLEYPQVITGSARLQSHDLQISYKAFLIESRFAEIKALDLADNYQLLAEAIEAKQQARYSYALLLASKLDFKEEEFQIHTALLKLELFGRTHDYLYSQPKACLAVIKSLLPHLETRLEVIRDCAKLYPLAVSMAELDAEVAIVKHEHYRDGFYYAGQLYTLPVQARRLLIQADLENSNQLNLLTKAQRFRMNQKLRAAGLTVHHLVSDALIEKAKTQLSKVS